MPVRAQKRDDQTALVMLPEVRAIFLSQEERLLGAPPLRVKDVTDGYDIALAAEGDIEGILNLQGRNQPDQGGTLSARFSHGWFEAAITAMPVVVARREGRVVGYLVSSPLSAYADVPVVQAMLAAYPGAADAYVYGPICVEEAERGRGLAGAMFAALRARLPGREGVLFIRRDNTASLRAHARMGMREVTGFTYGGVAFAALSYTGDRDP